MITLIYSVIGPVDSNHVNIYNAILALVFRALQSILCQCEWYGGGSGRGERIWECNGSSRVGGMGQGKKKREGTARDGQVARRGGRKCYHWSGMCRSTGGSTRGREPIPFVS